MKLNKESRDIRIKIKTTENTHLWKKLKQSPSVDLKNKYSQNLSNNRNVAGTYSTSN